MSYRRIWGIVGLLAVFGLALALFTNPTQAQGQNLLVNPDFEGEYTAYVPNPPIAACPVGTCSTAQMPAGWTPWWVVQKPGDENWYNRMPEWKPATAPFAQRILSGSRAMQYFTFGGTHTAGSYQQVTVPANSSVTFSVWGQAWSTGKSWDGELSDVNYSAEPTPVNMKIGIDPTGGTDPFSPNIVWSGTANPFDAYVQFVVNAQAQGDRVTAFVYSRPEELRKHNDIYWDAASLTAGGGAPVPAPATGSGGATQAAAAPAASFAIPPTSTPDAEGVIYTVVSGGDSIWSIAAKAGLTLDEILELNNLSKDDFIVVGDRLVIGYGDPGGSEPEAEVDEQADTAASDAPEGGTDSSQPPAELPTPTPQAIVESLGGRICLAAFNDLNQNAFQDPAEQLLAGVAFTITKDGAVVSNYISDGVSEPFCVTGLDAGVYQISRSVADDERLTTDSSWTVALTPEGAVALSFGSVRGVPADGTELADASVTTADIDSAETQTTDSAETDGSNSNSLILLVVIVVLLLLVAAVGFILLGRRGA
ncbi:MAG: LysM peptidoglycan-binding domain-containing protein [Anaerolineae bacterium]|nr:LysM peptidoglycan-binding domain-containing protein [Anaerolineae bacterium]MCO5197805.1 LysM peptidoglycan-binding domain-containing protein [Anaerolineae bacterium]MCO5205301.1 LysM peptidoglycan-binding domain-containing protein [Anaerolineae bacterium]